MLELEVNIELSKEDALLMIATDNRDCYFSLREAVEDQRFTLHVFKSDMPYAGTLQVSRNFLEKVVAGDKVAARQTILSECERQIKMRLQILKSCKEDIIKAKPGLMRSIRSVLREQQKSSEANPVPVIDQFIETMNKALLKDSGLLIVPLISIDSDQAASMLSLDDFCCTGQVSNVGNQESPRVLLWIEKNASESEGVQVSRLFLEKVAVGDTKSAARVLIQECEALVEQAFLKGRITEKWSNLWHG